MSNPKTKADSWFETYLEQEGYSFEHEPPWRERTGVDTRKQPDYLIERNGQRVVCEVKEFATTPITDRLTATANPNTGVSVISVSDKEMFGAVRRQVQEAAFFAESFENALGNGPNLPRTLFTGERDSRWGHIHDTQYGMVFEPGITAGTPSI